MPFELREVVPWGRSFDEYRRMFALTDADLAGRVLGCGDGPASFNAEATTAGARVVSVDPLYVADAAAIRVRVAETYQTVLTQTRQHAAEFVWDVIPSVDALGRIRMAAMDAFLDDFATNAARGRYVAAALPRLPFADDAFDLAICSHFLFLYSAHADAALHVDAITDMLRVAREARIFPLLELGGRRSRHLDDVLAALAERGFTTTVERVPYEFQRGGNEMLRARR